MIKDAGEIERLGIVAGNGPLPSLAMENAANQKVSVTVAAIEEEADPSLEEKASALHGDVTVERIGVGQLGKLLRIFKRRGVDQAVLLGQVRHARIFAPESKKPWKQLKHLPDLKMIRLLASMKQRDTGSLLRGVIESLEGEGIQILDSRVFLPQLLPGPGLLSSREPSSEELADFEYGRHVGFEIARLDLGQTIVIKNQAVVAIEAMEGTDETIRRAAKLVHGERLSVVKMSRPSLDMRFDVPVIGFQTLDVFKECKVSALAIDAEKTFILEKSNFLREADKAGITVMSY